MVYLDSSALVKLYVDEPESDDVRSLLALEPNAFTSIVTYAEVLATLARCLRDKRIGRPAYMRAKTAFEENWKQIAVVEMTRNVLAPTTRLVERHALRGFDAVHLCSALWTGKPIFACYDDRLRGAAAKEDLSVYPTDLH